MVLSNKHLSLIHMNITQKQTLYLHFKRIFELVENVNNSHVKNSVTITIKKEKNPLQFFCETRNKCLLIY